MDGKKTWEKSDSISGAGSPLDNERTRCDYDDSGCITSQNQIEGCVFVNV